MPHPLFSKQITTASAAPLVDALGAGAPATAPPPMPATCGAILCGTANTVVRAAGAPAGGFALEPPRASTDAGALAHRAGERLAVRTPFGGRRPSRPMRPRLRRWAPPSRSRPPERRPPQTRRARGRPAPTPKGFRRVPFPAATRPAVATATAHPPSVEALVVQRRAARPRRRPRCAVGRPWPARPPLWPPRRGGRAPSPPLALPVDRAPRRRGGPPPPSSEGRLCWRPPPARPSRPRGAPAWRWSAAARARSSPRPPSTRRCGWWGGCGAASRPARPRCGARVAPMSPCFSWRGGGAEAAVGARTPPGERAAVGGGRRRDGRPGAPPSVGEARRRVRGCGGGPSGCRVGRRCGTRGWPNGWGRLPTGLLGGALPLQRQPMGNPPRRPRGALADENMGAGRFRAKPPMPI